MNKLTKNDICDKWSINKKINLIINNYNHFLKIAKITITKIFFD